MIPLSSYADFESASTDVLNFLHRRLGFDLWMVTRTDAENWIVLNAADQGYGVKAGDVFKWSDSFCSRMIEGLGPQVAPDSKLIPAYASAPIGQQVEIGAYVGVPLARSDGQLIGTLCAIDPSPQPEQILDELPLIEMLARLLTTILENDLIAASAHRREEHALAKAMSDQLTGLYNRRGWEVLLEKEELRCKRFGLSAGTFSIELDDVKIVNEKFGYLRGDELIRQAAEAISSVTRNSDVVSRLGGDEFGILAVDCGVDGAQELGRRTRIALEEQGISASIGMSILQPTDTMLETFTRADRDKYVQKMERKSAKPGFPPIDIASQITPSEHEGRS